MDTTIAPPSAQTISDPVGIRALVDRIRATTGPVEFVKTYSDAMGAVQDYLTRGPQPQPHDQQAAEAWDAQREAIAKPPA